MIGLETNIKKSVTFADDRNTKHTYESKATDVLWEWPEFFERSRKESRRAGKQLRQQGGGQLLEGCFGSDRGQVQKYLNQYAKLEDGRGIERFACREMYEERKRDRTKAIKAILIGQSQAKARGMPQDVMVEELREVSLVYCINAKVFARRLGKADEAACYPKKKSKSSDCSVSSAQSTCSTQASTLSTQHSRAA